MQTGSSETLIGWKSGKTCTYVPLWDRMEGAWLWTLLGWIVVVSRSNRLFMQGSLQLNKKGLKTFVVFCYCLFDGGDSVQFLTAVAIGHLTHSLSKTEERQENEPEFLNVYGDHESIPSNQFRQPMDPGGPVR